MLCTIIYIQIVSDLCTAVNEFGPAQYRTRYYQFLRPHYSNKYLQDTFGCKAGWRVHKSSNEHLIDNGRVAPWEPKFGRPKIPQATVEAVQRFLLKNSR